MEFHWFGVSLVLSTLVGAGAAMGLVLLALFRVRRTDLLAGLFLAAAALLEMVCVVGEAGIRGFLVSILLSAGKYNESNYMLNAWSLLLPLLQAGVVVGVGLAAWRLTARARA